MRCERYNTVWSGMSSYCYWLIYSSSAVGLHTGVEVGGGNIDRCAGLAGLSGVHSEYGLLSFVNPGRLQPGAVTLYLSHRRFRYHWRIRHSGTERTSYTHDNIGQLEIWGKEPNVVPNMAVSPTESCDQNITSLPIDLRPIVRPVSESESERLYKRASRSERNLKRHMIFHARPYVTLHAC